MQITFRVKNEYDGKEIRNILKAELNMSNNMIKKVKLYGTMDVNGVHRRVIDTVNAGDEIFCAYEDDSGKLKSDSGIKLYYEDDWFAVCEKPSGMVTHPTHGHLDDSLLTALSDNSLHPVTRLDRETSGLIAIAKNGYAHNQICEGQMQKKYLAVQYGRFDDDFGTIDLPIKRRPDTIMIRDVDPEGYPSVTHYKVLFYDDINNISLTEFVLETGRCHQIRVHSTYLKHPLVGDGLYGPNSKDNPCDLFPNSKTMDDKIGRQALHAYHLELCHPISGEKMLFKSELPDDMMGLFDEKYKSDVRKALNEVLGKVD